MNPDGNSLGYFPEERFLRGNLVAKVPLIESSNGEEYSCFSVPSVFIFT